MNDDPEQQLIRIRRDFDHGFIEPALRSDAQGASMVQIYIATGRYLLPLGEIAGLFRCPALTPVPSHAPSCLGLGAIRGRIVAVHDLAPLLGIHVPSSEDRGWLVVAQRDAGIGFALAGVGGYIQVLWDTVLPMHEPSPIFIGHIVDHSSQRVPIIALTHLAESLQQRTISAEEKSDDELDV